MKILIIGFYSSLRKAELTMFHPFIGRLENDKRIETIFIITPFKHLENLYGELKKFKKIEIIDIFNFTCLMKSFLSSNIVFSMYGDALTKRQNFLSQLYSHYLLFLTSIFKKKIVMVSNTLFMPALLTLFRFYGKNIIYCSVRDDRSLLICKKFFKKSTCKLRTDLSFNFFKNIPFTKKKEGILLVCLRNNSHKIAKIERKRYSKQMSKLIDKTCHTLNLNRVLFLPLAFGVRKVGKDCLIHDDVKRQLKSRGLKIEAIKSAPSLHSLIREFERASVVLTSRFHGIIFSISLKKPLLTVDNDYKTLYFMQRHGLEEFYIVPNDIQNKKRIDSILRNVQEQDEKLEKIRKRVFKESKNHLNEIINLINL